MIDGMEHPQKVEIDTSLLKAIVAEAVRKALFEGRANLDSPLTEAEASIILGVKSQTLAVWRTKGTGPAYHKIGSNVRYSRADLESYIEKRRVPR